MSAEHRPTHDGAAIVNTELVWIPIAKRQPQRGRKLLLIRRPDGVTQLGLWTPDSHYTHWQGLPVFDPEEPY